MAFHSHPNPANRNARIDRMIGLIDPSGTDQNALRARTSIHLQSDLHTPPVREPGMLQRLQMLPLLAAALTVVLVLWAAGSVLDQPETAPTSVIIAGGPQALFDVPNDAPNYAPIYPPSTATETMDASVVSAASVWPDSRARADDQAEEQPPTF